MQHDTMPAYLSDFNIMTFGAPLVKAATMGEMAAVESDKKHIALLMVVSNNCEQIGDNAALVPHDANTEARVPALIATPRLINLSARMARPRLSRVPSVLGGHPTSSAASWMVKPRRSQRTIGVRYLSSRACNSRSRISCNSFHKPGGPGLGFRRAASCSLSSLRCRHV